MNPRPVSPTHRRRAAAGATLVEVLVAIVIASIGLLAMAGISAAALRYSKFSQHRASASQLAAEIAERMRANAYAPDALASYRYQESMTDQAELGTAPDPACLAVSDACTLEQVAAADLWQWRSNVRSELPGGSVAVSPDAAAPRSVDIWVAWRDAALASEQEIVRTGGAKECPLSLEASTDPNVRCVYLRVRL